MAITAGVSKKELKAIALAAKYHDIGKLTIPGEILNKPGKLTEEERKIIEGHAEAGYQMLQGLPEEIRRIVRYHHENEDGSGYFHLISKDIPYGAKILHICDVFDALTSSRCYKTAWPVNDALKFMHSFSRQHFDEQLLELFSTKVIPFVVAKKEKSA